MSFLLRRKFLHPLQPSFRSC